MFLQNNKPTIAVIITNHNYNDYLRKALLSVNKQTLQPDIVIVVDDSSDISCEDLITNHKWTIKTHYIKAHCHHPMTARKIGFTLTKTDYVCFLDADDQLLPEYLAQAILVLSNEDIDIAYSDIQKFGDETKLIKFPKDIKPEQLWQTNFLHVGCVVSRDAIILSQAFEKYPTTTNYHEDWLFWRNVVGMGFRYKKHTVPYLSRIHSKNRSKSIRNGTYFQIRAIDNSTFEWQWYETKDPTKQLILLNRFIKQTTADYVGWGIAKEQTNTTDENWLKLAAHMDHNIDMVYDTTNNRILFVGPVIRNIIIRTKDISKWPMKMTMV